MRTSSVSQENILPFAKSAKFTDKAVLNIQNIAQHLATHKNEELTLLCQLDLDENNHFEGVVTLNTPAETFFLTASQIVANRYSLTFLEKELSIRYSTLQSLLYAGSSPSLELTVRLLALHNTWDERAKTDDEGELMPRCITNLVTTDHIREHFHLWFPEFKASEVAKSDAIAKATVYGIMNEDDMSKVQLSSFSKLVQAACETYNKNYNVVWRDLFND